MQDEEIQRIISLLDPEKIRMFTMEDVTDLVKDGWIDLTDVRIMLQELLKLRQKVRNDATS